jgi:hypothetical protein
MSVKKLSKLSETKFAQKTTAPAGVVGPGNDEIRWKAEDALRTIHRAESHKKDKELMRHVKRMAKEQAKACGVK